MNNRLLTVFGAIVLILGAVGPAGWMWGDPLKEGRTETSAPVREQPEQQQSEAGSDNLPMPPFPPRIAEGDRYDKCMTMIADDPEGAEAIATSWQATGGGTAAIHCQALAAIATGEPETGAAMLEKLAHGSEIEGLTRAVLLGQAAEARLMADQPADALTDATEALTISPDDPDLLIGHANANDALERSNDAMRDLNQALLVDPSRGDALVLRASLWRRMDKLTEARSDIDRALAIDPEDADARHPSPGGRRSDRCAGGLDTRAKHRFKR
jgi:tetratricopeptide (TPR) repeat protein